MTTTDPFVGSTIDRRYLVESRIAQGGMATVYLAHDSRLDRRVALKVMRSSLAQDPQFVRRFIGEALAVAKLSHPNVVQVFDQGTDGPHVFLAMEYVPGRTLRDLLREQGRLSPRDALELMIPVLAGLGAAHMAGMVHRDVKPENVLLTEHGNVKVADFGLARAVEASQQGLTKTGALLGTAAYLAPEQISHNTSDARTDVYAAGIMLYELLIGAQPHQGESPIAVAYQHVNEDVPRPSRVLGGVPPEVDELVTRATERDPQYRPADAGRFLASVLEVYRGLPAAGAGSLPPAATEAAPVDQADDNRTQTLVGEFDFSEVQAAGGRFGDRRRWYPLWLVAGVMLVALVGFGWWMFLGRYETVPDLVGMSEDEAQQAASGVGLQYEVSDDPVYSDDITEGHVAEVTPAVGERILPGATVTVALSQGPRNVEMPDIVGESVDEAMESLEALGFADIERNDSVSYDHPVDTVISVDPAPGEPADREDTVVLRVSSGFSVPSVVGLEEGEARERLEESNLEVEVTDRHDDDVPAGQVLEQDPASGETAGGGDTVTIVVSSGPEEIEIPDVVGMTVDEATAELEELGFEVTVTRPFRVGDRVSEVRPDDRAAQGSEIELVVTPFGLRSSSSG